MSKIQFWKRITTLELLVFLQLLAVTAMSKIQFWKRITTILCRGSKGIVLWLLCQRYNFESESQPINVGSDKLGCCDCYVKDTILKANHNVLSIRSFKLLLWLLCQRYNFESESQLSLRQGQMEKSCDCYVKDTILKANHNQGKWGIKDMRAVTAMSKIQFWKRITTISRSNLYCFALWLLCQRYNFESESQHRKWGTCNGICCDCYVKDTILKANHNI